VFDNLSDRLRSTLANLTGHGRVSEADVEAATREIRLALLEADVNFKVVKEVVGRIREQAVGTEILGSLTAGQQIVKIVHDELVNLLGAGDATSSSRAAGPSSSRQIHTGPPLRTSSRPSETPSTSRSIGRPRGRRPSIS
jgi:signal recognition particle subunit SRP54